MKKLVYLCGADQNNFAEPHNNWRMRAFQFCLQHGLQVINPLTESKQTVNSNGLAFIGGDRNRREVESSLSLIDRSDFVFLNLHYPNEGVWMQLMHAHERGKYTVCWTPFPVSPWVVSYGRACFERFDSALEHLLSQSGDDHGRIIDWSISLERSLKHHAEQFPADGESEFLYFPGACRPLLLVAPHAAAYWNCGTLHYAEGYTGAITAALGRLCGAHAIVGHYCTPDDSLYTARVTDQPKFSTDPLVSMIAKTVELHGLRCLVVIRGANWVDYRDVRIVHHSEDMEIAEVLGQSLEKSFSLRQLNYRWEEAPSDRPSTLRALAQVLRIGVLEMFIHQSALIPKLQKAQYYNMVAALEGVLTAL